MGGSAGQHLGECEVIAVAHHRGLVALVDDRAAVEQAERFGVRTHDTLWVVVAAYKSLLGRDRVSAARIVDDLLATGMYLPFHDGESLFAWAFEEGLLP